MISFSRWLAFLCTITFFVGGTDFSVFAESLPARVPYIFTKIAETGPTFKTLDFYPALNDQGTVAFFAQGVPLGDGVYIGTGGSDPLTIADKSDFAGLWPGVSINNNGVVAFVAHTWVGGLTGIFTDRQGAVGYTPILQHWDQELASVNRFVSINDKEVVTFQYQETIYTGDGGPIQTIAGPSGSSGLPPFDNVYTPTINDHGTVAFAAQLDNGDYGIYTATGFDGEQVAYSENQLGWTSINNAGTVAYWAHSPPGTGYQEAIVIDTAESDGQVIASSPPLGSFKLQATLNDKGTVAFQANLSVGIDAILVGPDLKMVIRTGDLLFGSTVTILHLAAPHALNNEDEIAFHASLADGRDVIVRASPKPPCVGGSLTGDAFEANNTLPSAAPIGVGDHAVSLHTPLDVDYYSLMVPPIIPQLTSYVFRISCADIPVTVDLYNAQGYFQRRFGPNTEIDINLEEGEYILRVDAAKMGFYIFTSGLHWHKLRFDEPIPRYFWWLDPGGPVERFHTRLEEYFAVRVHPGTDTVRLLGKDVHARLFDRDGRLLAEGRKVQDAKRGLDGELLTIPDREKGQLVIVQVTRHPVRHPITYGRPLQTLRYSIEVTQ